MTLRVQTGITNRKFNIKDSYFVKDGWLSKGVRENSTGYRRRTGREQSLSTRPGEHTQERSLHSTGCGYRPQAGRALWGAGGLVLFHRNLPTGVLAGATRTSRRVGLAGSHPLPGSRKERTQSHCDTEASSPPGLVASLPPPLLTKPNTGLERKNMFTGPSSRVTEQRKVNLEQRHSTPITCTRVFAAWCIFHTRVT